MSPWAAAELDGLRIGVVGFGREGRATAAWLATHAPRTTIEVFDERAVSVPAGLRSHVGPLETLPLESCDRIVRAPGVSRYRPALQAVRDAGVPVTTASSLWFARPRSARVLAVTGTKGKSTVSALLAHLLRTAGLRVALGGNIGVPLLDLETDDVDVVVVELSSYQTADLEGAPDVALLTNLFPEHLDWHGSVERYYRDKLRLLELARGPALVNARNAEALHRAAALGARLATGPEAWEVGEREIRRAGVRVAPAPRWHLRGAHNRVNLECALATVEALGVEPAAALADLAAFRGLPHRQEIVVEAAGVRYVNDSIATTPHATLAALDAFRDRPLGVIVGGHDRGVDWDAFAARLAAEPVALVVVRGQNRERILEALADRAPRQAVLVQDSLEGAVRAARAALGEGGTVLLSPGAPSFGEFRDFEERGERFSAIVRQITDGA